MFTDKLSPIHGRRSSWWLRSSVLRPRDVRAIAQLVSWDGDFVLMAGTDPTTLRPVTIDELFDLPPEQRRDAYLSGHVHIVLGSYSDFETVAGPMISDGETDRPESYALPVNRYLRRNTRPRFPIHFLPYLVVPGLVTTGALIGVFVSAMVAPASTAPLLTIPLAGVFALAVALVNERRKWRKEPPSPPPHRLVP